MTALALGVMSATQLAVSSGESPARADAAVGSAGLFVPAQGTVLDTRTAVGGVSGPVAAYTWYPVQVGGVAGVPVTGVSAVQVSVTAFNPSLSGYLKLAANGAAETQTSALVYSGGGSFSASSIVALGPDGKIKVLAQRSVSLLIAVQGYYTAGDGAPAPGGYVPVPPRRLVDTRNGTGLPQAKLAVGSTTAIKVGGLASVPADASAVFLMLTGISSSTTGGTFTAYPSGTTKPANVALSYLPNTATILGAAVDLGTGGQFNLAVGSTGTAIDVVVDVVGYYSASSGTGAAFTAASARVYDSRIAPSVEFAGSATRRLPIGGVARVPLPDTGVSAYAISLQVIHPGPNIGFVAVGPGDQNAAFVSAVYLTPGDELRSNLVIAQPGADGTIQVFNHSPDPIDVVLDVEGWYSSGPGPKPNAADAQSSDHGAELTQTEPAAPIESSSAIASGVFTNPSGQPVANIPVVISVPETSAATEGSDSQRTVLATVTTDAQGAWSYTPPATLPDAVQAVADANNGVLNLEATAMGEAPDGTMLNGMAGASVAVATTSGTPADTAGLGADAPEAVAMHVVPATDPAATAPTDAEAAQSDASIAESQQTAYQPSTWQTNNAPSDASYNPDLVAGIDYRATSVTAPASFTPMCQIYDSVSKTTVAYTTVGEAHAYWDTKASFRFNSTLSNNFKVEISADGVHWKIGSSVKLETQTGRSTGFTNQGPYFGRQFQVPIKYRWTKTRYYCQFDPYHFTTSYSIRPVGYYIPAGGYVARMGNNVADNDGFSKWYNSNPNYRAVLRPNTYFAITSGKSITYGSAATVWGIGITQETIYNYNHEQRIDAGSSHVASHDIWGAKGSLNDNPGTIYSW